MGFLDEFQESLQGSLNPEVLIPAALQAAGVMLPKQVGGGYSRYILGPRVQALGVLAENLFGNLRERKTAEELATWAQGASPQARRLMLPPPMRQPERPGQPVPAQTPMTVPDTPWGGPPTPTPSVEGLSNRAVGEAQGGMPVTWGSLQQAPVGVSTETPQYVDLPTAPSPIREFIAGQPKRALGLMRNPRAVALLQGVGQERQDEYQRDLAQKGMDYLRGTFANPDNPTKDELRSGYFRILAQAPSLADAILKVRATDVKEEYQGLLLDLKEQAQIDRAERMRDRSEYERGVLDVRKEVTDLRERAEERQNRAEDRKRRESDERIQRWRTTVQQAGDREGRLREAHDAALKRGDTSEAVRIGRARLEKLRAMARLYERMAEEGDPLAKAELDRVTGEIERLELPSASPLAPPISDVPKGLAPKPQPTSTAPSGGPLPATQKYLRKP